MIKFCMNIRLYFSITIACVCVGALPTIVSGQTIQLQSLVYGIRDLKLGIVSSELPEPIPLPSTYRRRGELMDYAGPAEFSLYAQYQGKSQKITNIRIPESDLGGRGLIVVIAGEVDGRVNYIAQYFEDGLSNFPLEHVKFINIAPRAVAVAFGDQRFVIAPVKSSKAYPMGENNTVELKLAAQYGEEVKLKYDSTISRIENARSTFIVYEGHEARKPLKIVPITDYPE